MKPLTAVTLALALSGAALAQERPVATPSDPAREAPPLVPRGAVRPLHPLGPLRDPRRRVERARPSRDRRVIMNRRRIPVR